MEKFFNFITGFLISIFLLTATDFSTIGGGWQPLIKYIGPSILGACIFVNLIFLSREIDNLKKEIDNLKNLKN